MTSELDRVISLISDYPAVQHELARILRGDPLMHQLNRSAVEQDWDQTRALKTAVVVLAARADDLIKQLELAKQLNPPPIVMVEPQKQ